MTPARAAFELWASGVGIDITHDGLMYVDRDTHHMWAGFRAALTSPPLPVRCAPGDAERPGDRPQLDVSSQNSAGGVDASPALFGWAR